MRILLKAVNTEAEEMVGILMYAEIQKQKKQGYKKQRAARQLDIDTKAVRKYWDMNEGAFIEQQMESRERSKGMDPYREYVLEKIREHSEISSAIIYDRLQEELPFGRFKTSILRDMGVKT